VTVVPVLTRDAKYVFTPKGLNNAAQGKRSAALGENAIKNPNPERVASYAFSRRLDSTLSGLEFVRASHPRVAASRQPWAKL
jgi:hypothetical protein